MDNYSVLLKYVVKNYGAIQILKELSMKVVKGQIYGLLGSSGCGKTTLLNVIVGQKKIESGEVWVLGKKIGNKKSAIPGWKIGYMPQDIALVGEFTVKDAIFYFGRIFNMKGKNIKARYRELSDLLNLPPDDRFIKHCSGGQQRRVSFAIALVHKPQLLILDEPTVGIDPLLREKIWDHLVKLTKMEKISVIMTTHYIEECRQADRIGLMRGGRLLAEESPNRLLTIFNTESLEEVFLILSKQQEDEQKFTIDPTSFTNNSLDLYGDIGTSTSTISSSVQSIPVGYKSTDKLTKNIKEVSTTLNKKRMKALLDKNAKQFYRNPTTVIFLLGMPIVQILMMVYSVGLDMRNIPLGIVNDESCQDFSPNTAVRSELNITDCHFQNLSCKFLTQLDHNSKIKKVQYSNVKEARHDVTHGQISGIVYIPKNFTSSFENRFNQGLEATDDMLEFGEIKVWLDMSNHQIGTTLKRQLILLYIDFQKDIFGDCGYLSEAAEYPISIDFIYGTNEESYQVFVLPGTLITMMFFFGSIMTSQILITEKEEGIWDRSIIAGVTSTELTISHLVIQGMIAIFQAMEMLSIVYFIYEYKYVGSFWLMYCMVYLQGICGMSFGMFVSVVCGNQTMSFNAVMGFFLPIMIISGTLWPVEGMPKTLQIISKTCPCTLPIEAFNNIVKKGLSIGDAKVITGTLISVVWILIFVLMTLFFLKRQR